MASNPARSGGGLPSPAGLPIVIVAAFILAATASAQSFDEKLETCLACHGKTGQSEQEGVPSLGGQPSLFTALQLFLFREERRKSEPMTELAKGITDDELRQFSDAIAKLPPPKALADGLDKARYERGVALAKEHRCGSCHNADYSGGDQMPRVAAQREDYLLKALRDYKSGARIGMGATMAEALAPIDATGLADLAHYLAHFRL